MWVLIAVGLVLVGALAGLSGVAVYKPVQLVWLTTLFGGFQLAPCACTRPPSWATR